MPVKRPDIDHADRRDAAGASGLKLQPFSGGCVVAVAILHGARQACGRAVIVAAHNTQCHTVAIGQTCCTVWLSAKLFQRGNTSALAFFTYIGAQRANRASLLPER